MMGQKMTVSANSLPFPISPRLGANNPLAVDHALRREILAKTEEAIEEIKPRLFIVKVELDETVWSCGHAAPLTRKSTRFVANEFELLAQLETYLDSFFATWTAGTKPAVTVNRADSMTINIVVRRP